MTELENKMRRLRDSLAGDILRIYSSEEQIPTEKQKPPRLPTEDLERILGALHDGIRPGPGLEDLELLADIVCELIERRKAETDRSGWKTLKGAATY